MWPRDARHCPHCAAPLRALQNEGRLRPSCSACGFVLYHHPASAAAGLVVDPRGQLLLVRRAIEPFRGAWALPAGYQELEETPVQALEREVFEETGLTVRAEQLLDLLYLPGDPRRPANVALYLCRALSGRLVGGADVSAVGWFAPGALPEQMAFDNNRLIAARRSAIECYAAALRSD
jgi:8-oxo-dGTP diphosphatase